MHTFILDNEIIHHLEAKLEHLIGSRRDFGKEVVVERQEEQPTDEEVKSEPPEEQAQPIEEEVKSEPQEEQPPEDEKK